MSLIKNVAVIGASGNVGRFVVPELLATGFHVTAITRESSSSTFPSEVVVQKVDYDSPDSLKAAFAGQDAVVSTITTTAVNGQKAIVDAALAAGVKRFIPSEFGINTRILSGQEIGKILNGKIATVDYLQEKAGENPNFTWTGLSTGIFFDWVLDRGIANVNLSEKKAVVVDSGNEKFQSSNLTHIAKTIAAILKNPDKTANKYIASSSFYTSQNELIKVFEEATGSKISVTHQTSDELQKQGEEKLAKGDFMAFVDLLKARVLRDGANLTIKPEDNANDLLDIPYETVQETVSQWLSKKGTA